MMKRNQRWLLAVIAFGLVGSGCASVRRPEIELTGVRVGGIGLRGASLIAELDINNQNDFDIETDSIAYRLFANTSSDGSTWEPVLQRTMTQRILIEEDKTTRVEIPIEFNYSELSGAARTIIDRGILNYRIEGQAFMREPMRRTIPFTKTGSVSLSGAR
ncbi:MAG TPA: LEA type 2 family protein [Longimicrobiales bacterium]